MQDRNFVIQKYEITMAADPDELYPFRCDNHQKIAFPRGTSVRSGAWPESH